MAWEGLYFGTLNGVWQEGRFENLLEIFFWWENFRPEIQSVRLKIFYFHSWHN